MSDIHRHYDQLTPAEREFVDVVFDRVRYISQATGVPIASDDRIERAVDALAHCVIESRKP